LQASGKVVDKCAVDKSGPGTQLELVMFESHISDMPQSDASPASDIQVCIYCSVRLYLFLHILELYCVTMLHEHGMQIIRYTQILSMVKTY